MASDFAVPQFGQVMTDRRIIVLLSIDAARFGVHGSCSRDALDGDDGARRANDMFRFEEALG